MDFNGLMYLEAPSDYQIIRWSDNADMELPETLNIVNGILWINVFRGTIRLSDYQIILIWNYQKLLILLMEFNGLMYLEAPSDYQIIRWSDNSGMELPETFNIVNGILWVNVFRGTIKLSDYQMIR